ncbi:enoyl-CoA hydratase/isomerase family protein [Leptodontidium sp. 2 PMI_412]|nr:enoyl-CoA hydratase/isomerase family protein [Leptodontidium sp. 2 PMI_412]
MGLLLLLFPLLLSSVAALELPGYKTLLTSQKPGVLRVTFHNPDSSVNLWTPQMLLDVTDLVGRLQNDNETKAVVFNSDYPKFFMAHAELGGSQPFDPTFGSRTVEVLNNMTNLRQATIGAVEGRARGAGNEFLVSIDMRFATKAESVFGQPEVGLGIVPGGGGSQYVSRLIGRGRAMEYILSSADINANDAEAIGWINKAFDSSEEMYAHIDTITSRLALFPLEAIGAAKQSINLATRPPLADTLTDSSNFLRLLSNPTVQATLAKIPQVSGNTSEFDRELSLGDFLPRLYR